MKQRSSQSSLDWSLPELRAELLCELAPTCGMIDVLRVAMSFSLSLCGSWDSEPEGHWVPRRRNPALGMWRTWPGPHTVLGVGRCPVFPQIAFSSNSRPEWA